MKSQIDLFNARGECLYLDAQERECFYNAIQKLDPEKRMYCAMLYWTGARLSEPLGMNVSSIDVSSKFANMETLKQS